MQPLVRASRPSAPAPTRGVRAMVALRSLGRRSQGSLVACALGAYVVLGGAKADFGVAMGVATGAWAVVLGSRVRRKLREMGDAPLWLDVEVGALLAVGLE